MRTALLRGREHTVLGAIAAIAEGRAAIALSMGGARKHYYHKHPNEDAAAFAEGEGGILLAVADGHGGCEASEAAVERLLHTYAPPWTGIEPFGLGESWESTVRLALLDANDAILDRVASGGAESMRTTIAIALVRPQDDLLAFASMADSHIFHVGSHEVVDLAFDPHRQAFFLGFPLETGETLEQKYVVGIEQLAGTRAVLLVTDGISERGIGVDNPDLAVAEVAEEAGLAAPELRPLHAARAIVECAIEAHRRHGAGDNVSSAVVWLESAG